MFYHHDNIISCTFVPWLTREQCGTQKKWSFDEYNESSYVLHVPCSDKIKWVWIKTNNVGKACLDFNYSICTKWENHLRLMPILLLNPTLLNTLKSVTQTVFLAESININQLAVIHFIINRLFKGSPNYWMALISLLYFNWDIHMHIFYLDWAINWIINRLFGCM